MSQIIKVFKETCNNLKKTIHNLRLSYKTNNNSEYSDFTETMNSKMKSQKEYAKLEKDGPIFKSKSYGDRI